MSPVDQDRLEFNGVDGTTGKYRFPAMTVQELAATVCGEPPPEPWLLEELEWYRWYTSQDRWALKEGASAKSLAEAGWGIIFARGAEPEVREALSELLDHRRRQAGRYYREYTAAEGYLPGETKHGFLLRHGVGPGPVDPEKVPYYLLLVGGPSEIPFDFQYELDVPYAVGRIAFDHPTDYERYARGVVEVERGEVKRARKAVFVGMRNPDDRPTRLSHDHLVRPLAESLAADPDGWTVEAVLGAEATKARLQRLLGGGETPSLLFTASHGMCFSHGHPRQQSCQGALLCQDWPGPKKWLEKVPQDFYLAAADVADGASPQGLITFHFACFGAGTPEIDSFAHKHGQEGRRLAAHDFVARLPQRLLSHPRGSALAVIAHVDRAWSYSFRWPRAGDQLQTFQSTFKRLLDGHPVGSAMEFFNQRYAELSTDLTEETRRIRFGKTRDDQNLSSLGTARNDARSFVVLGDPAVRLPAAGNAEAIVE